jgi:serine/threonine protein kinase
MFITVFNRLMAPQQEDSPPSSAKPSSPSLSIRTTVATLFHPLTLTPNNNPAVCAPGLFYGSSGTRKRARQTSGNYLSSLHPTYTVGRVVGTGGFGSVRHGHDTRTGKPVALKFLSKTETTRGELDVEVKLQRAVHQFVGVNRILDVVQTPKEWVVVMEYLSGGELFDKLIASGAYSEREASKALRTVCSTIAHLHNCGIVHGDIKPENIMLKNENTDADLELIDFGMAFRLSQDNEDHQSLKDASDPLKTSKGPHDHPTQLPEAPIDSDATAFKNTRLPIDLLIRKREKKRQRRMTNAHRLGTTAYAPPEVLQANPVGEGVDMWALGVIMYILLSGTHPFDLSNEATDDEIEDNIIGSKLRFDDPVWEDVSPSAIELIRLLLSPDAHDRPSAEEAMEHPWLTEDAYNRLGAEPLTEVAENLLKYQRGRTYLRASVLAVLLGIADTPHKTRRRSSITKRDDNDNGIEDQIKLGGGQAKDMEQQDRPTSNVPEDSTMYVPVDPFQQTTHDSEDVIDTTTDASEQATPLIATPSTQPSATATQRTTRKHRGGAYNTTVLDETPISFAATRSSAALGTDEIERKVYGRLRLFDRDNKGFISHNDLRLVTSELGEKLTDQELSDMAEVATGGNDVTNGNDGAIMSVDQNDSTVHDSDGVVDTNSSIAALHHDDNQSGQSSNHNNDLRNNTRNTRKRNSRDDNTLAHLDIQRVLTSLRTQRFNYGDLITREGEVERIFHLLVAGKVQMTVTNSQGKEVAVNDVMPGEHFGAWELMHSDGKAKPRRKTGRCVADLCEVLTLPQSDFKVLTETFGNVRERMHGQLRLRTRDMLRHYLKEEVADYKEEVYDAGQLIYSQGEVCDSLFLVLEGEVDVTRETPVEDGDNKQMIKHVIVEQLGAGDFFPLGVLGISTFRTSTRGATVRAKVHTRVARVNGKEFRVFQDKHRSNDGTAEKHVVDDLHEDVIERHEKRAKKAGYDAKLEKK